MSMKQYNQQITYFRLMVLLSIKGSDGTFHCIMHIHIKTFHYPMHIYKNCDG